MTDEDFQPFPKLARLQRNIVITEKIDGTNAQVHVSDDGLTLRAGSRTRYITPGDDNFGFAAWVRDNTDELLRLGPGRHYGEWWGRGIQRGYGMPERRFSLFNTARWSANDTRPSCCSVVPVLYEGDFDNGAILGVLSRLRVVGSAAAPGFMQPEGIVVYHTAAGIAMKITLDNDGVPKSTLEAA